MVRSFSTEPVDPAVVDRLVGGALRSPTAGNTGGTAWLVLQGPEETAVYFDATTDEDWRAHYRDWIERRVAGRQSAALEVISSWSRNESALKPRYRSTERVRKAVRDMLAAETEDVELVQSLAP